MQLHGLHHVTAITANAKANLRFYTEVLGLRLVKKTVNQDDVSAYHLFYADKLGSPGTDLTFFDWPQIGPKGIGTDTATRTMFRVSGPAALVFWQKRFDTLGITHSGIIKLGEREAIRFADPEGQSLVLVDDAGAPFEGEPWEIEAVPPDSGRARAGLALCRDPGGRVGRRALALPEPFGEHAL